MRKIHTFEFTPELEAKLKTYAAQSGESKSAIVREAVAEYLSRRGAPKTSAHELAADLAGVVGGPGDLSYNPNYMADYGRAAADLGRHRPARRVSRSKR